MFIHLAHISQTAPLAHLQQLPLHTPNHDYVGTEWDSDLYKVQEPPRHRVQTAWTVASNVSRGNPSSNYPLDGASINADLQRHRTLQQSARSKVPKPGFSHAKPVYYEIAEPFAPLERFEDDHAVPDDATQKANCTPYRSGYDVSVFAPQAPRALSQYDQLEDSSTDT